MIHIINTHGEKRTTLKKVGDILWEFLLESGRKNYHLKGEEPSDSAELTVHCYLEKKGIQSLINSLKLIIEEKPSEIKEYPIIWKENPAEISLMGDYDGDTYWICIYARWKYFRHIHVDRAFYEIFDTSEEQDHEFEYGKRGLTMPLMEQNIKDYINELEREIGEPVTNWEKEKN